MATGAPGTNGVWQYGEDDSEATFSALLNKAASTTDTQFGVDRGRLTSVEGRATALEARPLAGLVPIVPTSVVIGTGTGGANALGQVTFANATSVSLNNVFTTAYRNYKIHFKSDGNTTGTVTFLRLRAANTDNAVATYNQTGFFSRTNGATAALSYTNQTLFDMGRTSNNAQQRSFTSIEMADPRVSTATSMTVNFIGQDPTSIVGGFIQSIHNSTDLFDGFTIFPQSGNMWGLVQVFGYND